MLDGASTALIEPAAVNINAVEINEPDCDGYSQASDIEDPLDPADFAEESDSPDDQDVAPSEPANVADRSEKEQQNEKFTVLRTTTSLHDDWLHRGEFLPSMSFIVCASRVHSVRKPVKVNADSPEIYFPFQPHYPLLSTNTKQSSSDKAGWTFLPALHGRFTRRARRIQLSVVRQHTLPRTWLLLRSADVSQICF